MKFNKILHPELVLGLRGDPKLIKIYKKMVHDIQFIENSNDCLMNDFVNKFSIDEKRALSLMQKFRVEQGKVFHVNKDFLEALSNVERGISIKFLPEKFLGYISFPEKTVYDESDEIQGVYVHIKKNFESNNLLFWAAYIGHDVNIVGSVSIFVKENSSLADLMIELENKESWFKDSEKILKLRSKVFNTALNAVMYYNSFEPDVKRVISNSKLSNKQVIKLKHKTGVENQCLVDVTFLNWNYAKQRNYSKDSTWINSFPRWQPCGPKLSQVKLIWVKEHERTFKIDVQNAKV